MTDCPAAMKNRFVAWEKKIETNDQAYCEGGYLKNQCLQTDAADRIT